MSSSKLRMTFQGTRRRRRHALLVAMFAAALSSSCTVRQQPPAESKGALAQQRTELDVQAIVMNMADDYSIALAEALRPISMNDDLDSTSRMIASGMQRNGMGSAIDIAVSPNPDVALLDMLVLVSLQRWAIAKHGVDVGIPESDLSKAAALLELAEESAWQSASSLLSDAQQQTLRSLIAEWIKENPDHYMVAFVRFDEFVNVRRDQAQQEAAKGLLKEVSEATASVDSVRLLGERALWFAGRYPFVLGQQVESTVYQVTDQPDIKAAINTLESVRELTSQLATRADSLERDLSAQQKLLFTNLAAERATAIEQAKVAFSEVVHEAAEDFEVRIAAARNEAVAQTFDRLAVERTNLVNDLQSNEGTLRDIMADLRSTLGASDSLAKELSGTVNAIDRVVARFDQEAKADGTALDMKDLRDAAIETRNAAEKLTVLLDKTSELDLVTTSLVNRMFWRGLWLVLALIGGLALIRLLPQRTPGSTKDR